MKNKVAICIAGEMRYWEITKKPTPPRQQHGVYCLDVWIRPGEHYQPKAQLLQRPGR